jgi:ketosteroid isomerase-like protein
MTGAAAAAAALKSQLDNAKKEIGTAYGTLMNGYQKGDWKVTSQIYGPNCTILAPGKPSIKGKEAAESYWKQLKEETGVTKMELKAEEINGQGEWFFERGAYKLFKGDKPFEERKYLKIWRKWEGKLMIHSYCFNIIPL